MAMAIMACEARAMTKYSNVASGIGGCSEAAALASASARRARSASASDFQSSSAEKWFDGSVSVMVVGYPFHREV